MLESRAFSHDSIFQAEHGHSDTEPLRILSQENIHGKIQVLQVNTLGNVCSRLIIAHFINTYQCD